MSCGYGEPAQVPAAQYPCLGGCGCWTATPSTCLGCWLTAQSYTRRQVARLDDGDPRRHRVRD